jgi:1-acylglycerone phosphate reductase
MPAKKKAIGLIETGIYGSSKAAINHLSNTLRLELEPLGIKVITVIAGIISSKFHANMSPSTFSLPPDSQYKSMEGVMRDMNEGKGMAANASPAESFAEEVYRDTVGGRRGNTYSGALGWTGKWVIWWWPTWLTVSF